MKLLAPFPAEPIDEVLHEHGDVFPALLQRGQVDVEDVQAEVEVLAEAPRLDLVLEIPVRGADHPDIHHDLALPTEAAQPLLLEHAEELGLQLDGNLSHLVEEQRAAIRQLPGAEAPLIGPGEGTALVAEHLALDQRGGDGGAVDGDERLFAPGAELVDGAGHHLLAGAALSGDHHARFGGGDLLHQLHCPAHGRRIAHQPDAGVDLPEAPAQHMHLVQRLLLLQGPLEDDLETGRIQRLLDEVEDAFANRLHRRVDGSLAGDDDDGSVGLLLAQRPDERQPVEFRHHQVADDHVRMHLGGDLQGRVAVSGPVDLVAPSLQ